MQNNNNNNNIEKLQEEGPKYGYYLQLEKCYCIVHPAYVAEANKMFSKMAVQVVTGFKYVGGFIGTEQDTNIWLTDKVEKWVNSINCLSKAAETYPHSAYTVLTKSLQLEWTYKIVSGAEFFFIPVKEALINTFLPKMSSLDLTFEKKSLMCKPVRYVGMGIDDPIFDAPLAFETSRESTKMMIEAITSGDTIDMDAYEQENSNKKVQAKKNKNSKTQKFKKQ